MAKAPSARVSKTSGQGVSRLSYQKGYSLGNRGTGTPGPSPSVKGERGAEMKSSRSSSKGKFNKAGELNISYGETLFPTDLEDVKSIGERKPPKTGFLKLGKKHKYKEGKDDSGFVKGRYAK